jgi:hypothetical protein
MTQTTILLFTLGMLAGLPAGYAFGWLTDPRRIWVMDANTLLKTFRMERDLQSLAAWVVHMDSRRAAR